LDAADEFVFTAFFIFKIVVREIAIGLLELAFERIPTAFDFEFIHAGGSCLRFLAVACGGRGVRGLTAIRSSVGVMFRFLLRLGRLQVQILLVLAALLLAARAALPWFVLRYVNEKINSMPGYGGHIADVDIHLWRGAYTVKGIDIVKTDGRVPVPFFSSPAVDLSVEWAAIFQGSLVAKIFFDRPEINFVAGPTKETSQVGVDKPWFSVIKKLFPLDINRCEVRDGSVHYRDFHSKPKIDLTVDRIHLMVTNLTNSSRLSKSLVAHLDLTARVFHSGKLGAKASLDPRPRRATFTFATTMSPVPLTELNSFTEAYASFDFRGGTFSMASELEAKNGHVEGYLKPLFDNITIIDLKQDIKNPLKLAWEAIIAGVTRLLRNQPHNRLATVIPIRGDFDAPGFEAMPAVGNLLRNEFIHVYNGNLEGSPEANGRPAATPAPKKKESGGFSLFKKPAK